MLLNILKASFITFAILFIISVLIFKLCTKLKYNKIKTSAFVPMIAIFLGAYIILAIIFAFFKPYMLIFALLPFVIGKFATYKTEGLYSLIQIFCIIISIICI